jgi:hypothetical protein
MERDCLGPGVGRGVIFVRTAPMTIEIPTTGERFTGRLTEEPAGPLCLTGRSNRPCYVLSRVLSIGWRIVECTPDERRLMGTHGITLDRLDLTGAPGLLARPVVPRGSEKGQAARCNRQSRRRKRMERLAE